MTLHAIKISATDFQITHFHVPQNWYRDELWKRAQAPVKIGADDAKRINSYFGAEAHHYIAQMQKSAVHGHLTILTKSNQQIQFIHARKKDGQPGELVEIKLRHNHISPEDVRWIMAARIKAGKSLDIDSLNISGTREFRQNFTDMWMAELNDTNPRPEWRYQDDKAGPDADKGGPGAGADGPDRGSTQEKAKPEEQGDLLLMLTRAHSAMLEHFRKNSKTMSSAEKLAAIRKLNLADAVCCTVAGCKNEAGISGKFTPAILAGLKKDLGDTRPGTNVPLSPDWESMARRLNIHQGSADTGPKAAAPKPEGPKTQEAAPPPPPRALPGPQPSA